MEALENNSLSSCFRIGQRVRVNNKGFVPYSLCNITITGLSISTVIAKLSFVNKGKSCVELDVYIPYEHLEIE